MVQEVPQPQNPWFLHHWRELCWYLSLLFLPIFLFLILCSQTDLFLSFCKGHYVPQLAELIYERNKRSSKDSYINLKGFMVYMPHLPTKLIHTPLSRSWSWSWDSHIFIKYCYLLKVVIDNQIGNAVINDETDDMGLIEFAWSHAIISDQLYHGIIKECDFIRDNPTNLCSNHIKGLLEAYSDIDMYSIYTPVCLSSSKETYRKFVTAPRLFAQHVSWLVSNPLSCVMKKFPGL